MMRSVPRRALALRSVLSTRRLTTAAQKVQDLPKQIEIAQGPDREELEDEEKGQVRFERGPLKSTFGTFESPVVVPSTKDYRIVGCVGDGGEREHELLWFRLTPKRKHMCAVCGQYFVMQQEAGASHSH